MDSNNSFNNELEKLIDKLLDSSKEKNIIIAIDGRCASGKTTLASELSKIYDCNVFHMDDFFLRPNQRTKERLATAGENVDHERFLEEVLIPLSKNEVVRYKRFDCHKLCFEEPATVTSKKLNIVEGTYCLHDLLVDYYDLKIFLDISPDLQRERIMNRCIPEVAEKFFSTWIPLEEDYFVKKEVRKRADLIRGNN